jgi:hypothetical protein
LPSGAAPASYLFGNEGVGIVRADGSNAFNFSILPNFRVSESRKREFRVELFNASNDAKFGNLGIVLRGGFRDPQFRGAGAAGTIGAAIRVLSESEFAVPVASKNAYTNSNWRSPK